MNDGLRDVHRDAIFSVFAADNRIERAVLFGSRATGTNTMSSDVIIALFGNGLTLTDQTCIAAALDKIPIAQSVDLVLYDSVRNEELGRHILKYGIEWYQRNDSEIASDIRLTPAWSDRCTTVLGNCVLINRSTYSPTENWAYINYLDTGSITENRISKIQCLVIGRDRVPSRARRKVQAGDIVYSTVRPNHRHFGLLKRIPDNFIASTGFAVIRGKDSVAHTDFIYWFLTQSRITKHLQTIAEHSTTAYPSIKPDDIRALEVDLPSLPEQRAIAHVLCTLDDKIELNRRMNVTLEAAARVLFKSWFVNFDPVRAKMEGRDTGLPKHIADLFPSRLVDSELGRIPKRWDVFSLDQLATHHTKSTSPLSFPEEEFEHFSIPAYDADRCPSVEMGATIRSNKTIVCNDAVLLSKMNPQIPRVWMPADSRGKLQVCSTEFLVFTPRPPANRSLLFALFADQSFQALLKSMVTGTSKSHQRVPPKALKTQQVLAGSPRVFRVFDELVGSMLAKITNNRSEATALATVRDTLLPKLISGRFSLSVNE